MLATALVDHTAARIVAAGALDTAGPLQQAVQGELRAAVATGEAEVVRKLLVLDGADPNTAAWHGMPTLLKQARTKGHTAVADLLKQHGAVLSAAETQQQLCAAIEVDDGDTVRKLLFVDGADPVVCGPDDPVWPPLYLAARGGHVDAVMALL